MRLSCIPGISERRAVGPVPSFERTEPRQQPSLKKLKHSEAVCPQSMASIRWAEPARPLARNLEEARQQTARRGSLSIEPQAGKVPAPTDRRKSGPVLDRPTRLGAPGPPPCAAQKATPV